MDGHRQLYGEGRVEAATVSDIFYLLSQGNFIFTRELKIRDI